tara:strand:- start:639 stop:1130 length:492 start_codon:yes stop_codon:yes gene_type:complete
MARLNIDTGIEGNTATGDTIRTAMSKINTNFEEVFSLVGDGDNGLLTTSVTNGNIKVQPNGTGVVEIDSLQITDSAITSITTNSDVTITANGTGNIVLGAITINGTTISSQDSTKISINEPLDIDGNLVVSASQIDFTNVPTSDPNVAGRIFRSGNDLRISTG